MSLHWTDLYRENVKRYRLRPGQAMFNAWQDYSPRTAEVFRGTGVDCFYDDSKIGDFVAACLKHEMGRVIRTL